MSTDGVEDFPAGSRGRPERELRGEQAESREEARA